MRRIGNLYLVETEDERILQIYGAKGSSGGGGGFVDPNADYYVSSSASGGGAGTIDDPLTFAEAQTAITTMVAGETMAFKGGDEFYGNLSISSKTGTALNPFTFTSYGTGKAVIKGSEAITGWTQNGNVWSKAIASQVYQVFDSSGNPLQNSYSSDFTVTSVVDGTNFICTDLIDHPDITGSTIQHRRYVWDVSSVTVTAFNSTTGQVTVNSSGRYGFLAGIPFRIVNDEAYMDSDGDWVYKSGTLKVYSTTSPTVEASELENGMVLTSSEHIKFDNISIKNFYNHGISTDAGYLSIENCNIENNYYRNIYASDSGSSNILINNCIISGSTYQSVSINSTDATITNNTISDTGAENLYTHKGATASRAISSAGANTDILYNTISNSGYNGIDFTGNYSNIKYNFINGFCEFLTDGGAVYTYTGMTTGVWNTPKGQFSEVMYNIILGDANNQDETIIGVYTDDCTVDVEIAYNTMADMQRGVLLHNNKRVNVHDNKIHNTRTGISITEDSLGGDGETYDNVLTNNDVVIFGRDINHSALNLFSAYNNYIFHTGSNNKYYNLGYTHPVNILNSSIFFWAANQYTRDHTVSELKTLISSESGSISNTVEQNPYSISSEGSELISNGDFTSGTTGWFADSGGSISVSGGYLTLTTSVAKSRLGASGSTFTATTGEYYLLKFKAKSSTAHKLRVALVQLGSPYWGTGMQQANIGTDWTSLEFLLYWETDTSTARLEIWDETDIGFDIDDVSVKNVSLGTKPIVSTVAYNYSSNTQDINIPVGTWYDLDGVERTGTVSVGAYSGDILINYQYVPPSTLMEFDATNTTPSTGSLTNVTGDPWTVVRASEATYIDGSGVLQTVAANVPRIENGKTLIELQDTNQIQYSEDYTQASWNKYSTTVTGNDTTAPDGTLTADKLEKTDTQVFRGVLRSAGISLSESTQYYISAFVKQGTGISAGVKVSFNNSPSNIDLDAKIVFASETMSVREASGSWDDYGFVSLANGWYLVWGTFTTGTSISSILAGVVTDGGTTANVYNYFWGSHLSEVKGSYIPSTGTSSTTREADVITVSAPAGASQYIEWIDGVEQSPIAVSGGQTITMKNGTTKLVVT